ncbi:MAG: TlpA family protein disulfide reductase [Deltaproteobacteria bacterium]|nr:TlpA family protein disulfide reductase [Deltaproteobacteria bacterium]
MNKKILFLLVALLAVIIAWSYLKEGTNGGYSLVGKQAPDFSLKDEKGQKVALSQYRGKVVLLHFWATWCPPCVEEFPSLDRLVQKFDGAKFALIAVSVDEEGMEAVREYGTYRLPESFLIDKNGKVTKKISGPQDWEHPRWEGTIGKMVNVK